MPETRDATWLWFQKILDRILPHIPEPAWGRMTFIGGAFCDSEKQGEIAAFFTDRIDSMTGGARNLAKTLEGIDLCLAKVQRHQEEMGMWLGQ